MLKLSPGTWLTNNWKVKIHIWHYCFLFSLRYKWSNWATILHISWQQWCYDMCKIVSQKSKIFTSKMKISFYEVSLLRSETICEITAGMIQWPLMVAWACWQTVSNKRPWLLITSVQMREADPSWHRDCWCPGGANALYREKWSSVFCSHMVWDNDFHYTIELSVYQDPSS